jgi:putative oligomerization/nucleic acid binding protein/phospholipase D-like protein
MTTAMPLAAQDYPLLNLFWTILELFVWVLWFFLLFRIIIDIFRSDDLGGWGKALWLIFVIVAPFLGVLVYVIARGGSMGQRDARQAQEADAAARSYIQSAAGTSTSTAEELTKLAGLRDQGVITDAEFAAQKAKVLSS